MNRNNYLDAGDHLLPPAEARLVTYLAVIGIVVPVVAFGAWRYAVKELDAIDEGALRADRRRSIDHARALAKIASIFYLILAVIEIGYRA